MTRIYLCFLCVLCCYSLTAQHQKKTSNPENQLKEGFQFYTTLNNGSEGPTGYQTLTNLDFFIWMEEEYDFRLGSYAIDPGKLLQNHKEGLINPEQLIELFPDHYQQITTKLDILNADIEIINPTNNNLDKTYIEKYSSNTKTTKNKRSAIIEEEYNSKNENTDGVCFTSPLDNWDDELIMQAFNHNTYKMPRICGNPWFLKDSEFSKLARINNLYQEYQSILNKRIYLPESYGINAMSRGNKSKRILTLTNMSWETKFVTVRLDEEIGLIEGDRIEIRSYHPTERIVGYYPYSQILDLEVPPFRTALFYIGPPIDEDLTLLGFDYLVEKNNATEMKIRVMEPPVRGRTASILLKDRFKGFEVNDKPISIKSVEKYRTRLKNPTNGDPFYYRMIGNFKKIEITPESEILYESTVFKADNDALEARSIERSEDSFNQAVQNAQNAFINQPSFIESESWDKYLFDNDLKTAFSVNKNRLEGSDTVSRCLRVDMGSKTLLDEIRIIVDNENDLLPQRIGETYTIETSEDLITWTTHVYEASLDSKITINTPIRYVRVPSAPHRILEFEGYKNGFKHSIVQWSASNLFPHPKDKKPIKIVKYTRTLRKVHSNSLLCIALEGKHGNEGAYVAAKINDTYVGCSNRSISYPSNTWQKLNKESDSNYTYFVPLSADMSLEKLEIFVMCYDENNIKIVPRVYMTSDDPYNSSTLRVIKK